MGTTIETRHALRVRAIFIAAIVAVMAALMIQAPRSGAVSNTVEGEPTNITAQFTNVTDLLAGQLVSVSITTTDGFGGYEAKLCKPGLSSWTLTNFGYTGSSAGRCVKQFSPGGLNPADGGLDFDPATAGIQPPPILNPSTGGYWIPTVSGSNSPETKTFQFRVGTGSAEWFNTSNDGPFNVTCGFGASCDLVVRVVHGGNTTWLIQPLGYADPTATTTTTPPTTPPTTTPPTTVPSTTPTSTGASTTSTSMAGGTTATTVTVAGAGASSGSGSGGALAFTGASTRDLLSLALLLLGIGLFVIGEIERRRSRS